MLLHHCLWGTWAYDFACGVPTACKAHTQISLLLLSGSLRTSVLPPSMLTVLAATQHCFGVHVEEHVHCMRTNIGDLLHNWFA